MPLHGDDGDTGIEFFNLMCDHTVRCWAAERAITLVRPSMWWRRLHLRGSGTRSLPGWAPDSRRSARCGHLDTTPLGSTNHWRERGGSAIAPLEGVQSGVAVVHLVLLARTSLLVRLGSLTR